MRQTLTGIVTAISMMTAGAAPAMACGFGGCSPCQAYASPCAPAYSYAPAYNYNYSGCGNCGGSNYGLLAAPETQYYYVNQGPTYSGPGEFAPPPAYEEDAVPYYQPHHYYRPWRHSYRYGYLPHRYGYAPHRYGYMPHRYGYHFAPYYYGRHVLRRYY